MTTQAPIPDPFARCEDSCTHDLAQGVMVEELLGGDGPHPAVWAETATGGWMLGRELRSRLANRPDAA